MHMVYVYVRVPAFQNLEVLLKVHIVGYKGIKIVAVWYTWKYRQKRTWNVKWKPEYRLCGRWSNCKGPSTQES